MFDQYAPKTFSLCFSLCIVIYIYFRIYVSISSYYRKYMVITIIIVQTSNIFQKIKIKKIILVVLHRLYVNSRCNRHENILKYTKCNKLLRNKQVEWFLYISIRVDIHWHIAHRYEKCTQRWFQTWKHNIKTLPLVEASSAGWVASGKPRNIKQTVERFQA